MLANRFRSPWVYSPSNAELKEPDIWNILLNDTDIRAIRQRRNQNLIRPWRVTPSPHASQRKADKTTADASKRKAAICNEALSYLSNFDEARFLLSDAFYLGRRYGEIKYEEMTVSLDGTPPMQWFVPVAITDVDRRRFHWVPEWDTQKGSAKKTGIHLDMFDTNEYKWRTVTTDHRRRLIEYIWENSEDRIGYGLGALECLFFTHYFATGSIKKLMEWLDRLANGFLIGKLDSLRAASTDRDNDSVTNTMKNMLQKIRSEHVVVLGDGDSIELVESSGTGFEAALKLRRYFIESAERLCNGAVRPAGHSVDGTGSKAASQEEGDTSESYYQYPREHLDAAIDQQLLGGFLYFNESNFDMLGLGNDIAKRPRYTSDQIKRQDPKTRLEVLKLANEMVAIKASEVYEAAETAPPDEDEEQIDAKPQMMETGFGGASNPFGGSGDEKGGETSGQDDKGGGPR